MDTKTRLKYMRKKRLKRIETSASRVIGFGYVWKLDSVNNHKKVIELAKCLVYRVLELVVLCLISAAIQGEGPG